MDIRGMQLFLHLAGSLHFGRTSQACNISPSALSRAIQRLEDEVGQQLLERDNRSVRLTRAGTLFRDYAADSLQRWDRLRESLLEEQHTLRGELSIYGSVTACYSILPGILERFRARYPMVNLKLKTGDAADALPAVLNERADLTVAARDDPMPRQIAFQPITSTPLVFIVPEVPSAAGEAIRELPIPWHRIPMILSERGLSRRRVDGWFRDRGIAPQIYAQVAGNEAIMVMVSLGCGVGVVPKLVVEKSPLLAEVRILENGPELQPYVVGICALARRLESPMIRAFWELAREEAREHDGQYPGAEQDQEYRKKDRPLSGS